MIKFAADDFLLLTELDFGVDICEVKVKGVFLIFILYSLILGFFRFLTLGSFFRFLPLSFTRIYKKEFSTLHPSPF